MANIKDEELTSALDKIDVTFDLQQYQIVRSQDRQRRINKEKLVNKGRLLMISDHSDPLASPGAKEVGGQNVYVYHLAKELGHMGWDVDVFTRWDSSAKVQIGRIGPRARVIRIKAGPKHYVPRDETAEFLSEFLDNIIAFKRENNITYNLIHTHYWMSGWLGLKLRNLWDIPLVHTPHSLGYVRYYTLKEMGKQPVNDDFFKVRIKWETLIYGRANMVLTTTPYEKQEIIDYYHASNANIAVVPIGIDQNMFKPISRTIARRKIGHEIDQRILLYAGRLEWRKGIETLIEAIPFMIKNYKFDRSTLKVLIVGRKTGPDKVEYERLRILAEKIGVSDVVSFLGSKERADIHFYYSAANACIVPSYYESFGIVPLEAIACNCPVVASAVGGLQYTVRPGTNGFLFEPKSPEDLAAAVNKVFSKKLNIQEKVQQFSERVLSEEFSWKAIAEEVENNYYSIMKITNPA